MRDNEQKSSSVARMLVRTSLGSRTSLGRVLDVGCGSGSILEACTPLATSLAGIDISSAFLEAAKQRLPNADLSLGSVEGGALPFADASFQTIFFCDVIEHLRSPYLACKELARVLAPGGNLLVTTPNAGSLVRRVSGDRWFGLQDPSHIYFFDSFTLGNVLRQAGLAVTMATTNGFTGSALLDGVMRLSGNGGTLTMLASR